MRFLKSLMVLAVVAAAGCGPVGGDPNTPDAYNRGTIHISADESFRPVLDAEVKVYQASYPDTKILVDYKPEAECLKDAFNDSVRMIITTRRFTEKELTSITDSLKLEPHQSTIAYDAIAVVVNKHGIDSFFTMPELKSLVSGKTAGLTPVFDGVRATSTVRFMLDSVLKGIPLGSNVVAAQNSEGVLNYVAQNKTAVGFIGVSWIGNPEDTTQLSFQHKVTLANIQSTDNPDGYVKPYQANIYARRYPMVRDLVYLLKEKYQGLGIGFANFLNSDRGQLVFRRAYLLPAKMPFWIRPATLNQQPQ